MIRYTITFSGRVQGVFFRATTEALARDLAVTGWVRNEPDGSVRCVVEGERAEIDRFLAAVADAEKGNIDEVVVEESPATGQFDGFGIRR